MVRPYERGTGVVASFDGPRGLGTIRGSNGGELPFHCTSIADGSRTISEGERVRFLVTPGPLGRWEASEIEPG